MGKIFLIAFGILVSSCDGFKVTAGSSVGADATATSFDGAALYQQNCAVCHGDLASSAKLGVTADQIANAIQTIPDMSSLSQLTPDQISAVAVALNPATPSPTPTPDPTVPTPTPTPPPHSIPTVEYFGHFDFSDPKGPIYSWSASSMFLTFKGSSVTAKLILKGEQFYVSRIDGGAVNRIKMLPSASAQTLTLATGLNPNVEHTILLFKETETDFTGGQFLGFSVDGGPALVAGTTKKYPLRLEFIGDWIACGQWNYLDKTTGSCPSTEHGADAPLYESAFNAYPQQTADILGAPPATNICSSLFGVYQSHGSTGNIAGNFYPYIGGFFAPYSTTPYDFGANPSPDVVVINLGGADYHGATTTDAQFESNYKALIAMVRKHYPNAHIICATGPYLNGGTPQVQAVVNYENTTLRDSKVHFLDLAPYNTYACFGRPNAEGNRNTAMQVAALIRQLGF